MLVPLSALVVALAVLAALVFSRFARNDAWKATVTPLASIIGSGFLISGPLLAREFGSLAIVAMALLLALAFAVGGVIRFNIAHAEPRLEENRERDPVRWLARGTQSVLALAYAVSVAYYLKLLAEFGLKPIAVAEESRALIANVAVTILIVAIAVIAKLGGPRRVEHVAEGSVSVKLGIIAGLLAGVAIWWATNQELAQPLPAARLSWQSIPMLLGLLITVQGFETSRYLGALYPAALRISTMRRAQWIASGIYLAFVALLTPVLASASLVEDVTGIVDVMRLIAAPLAWFVLVGALASQLSAAVADAIGSAGLINEISRRSVSMDAGFAVTSALAIAVVWLTDPFEVVAVASRAFALFYALQCLIAVIVSRDTPARPWQRGWFTLLGIICIVAALVGAPAEG